MPLAEAALQLQLRAAWAPHHPHAHPARPSTATPAGITAPGDDSNYGSAGVLDVLCLQALSKRIHYGKFVAEAKFRWGLGGAAPGPCPAGGLRVPLRWRG